MQKWCRLINFIVALAVTITATSAMAQPRSIDARTLDIAGVKTGMDFDQSIAAVIKHFKISRNQISIDRFQTINPVTKTKLPQYFTYENRGEKLSVYFEGRVPLDKARPLVVSMVKYELPFSAQNKEAMAEAATAKYGQQSNFPNKLPMQWCANPSTNVGVGCGNEQQALVELSQVSMTLIDPAWQQARIQVGVDAQKRNPGF